MANFTRISNIQIYARHKLAQHITFYFFRTLAIKIATESITCKCGATTVEFQGDPAFCGFCHCLDCRSAGLSAIHQGLAFPSDKVEITKGSCIECKQRETRTDFNCSKCGQYFFNNNKFGMKCTSALNFLDDAGKVKKRFAPQLHIQYAERIVDVDDALPKYLDFPASFGGSGKQYSKE